VRYDGRVQFIFFTIVIPGIERVISLAGRVRRAVWLDSAIKRISLFGQGEWKGGKKNIQTFFECVCYYLRGKKTPGEFCYTFFYAQTWTI
jgi:hypothetical protein